MVSPLQSLLLVGASALAGAINSVAGGGTLLTFPALVAVGQLSTVANATNTAALWPGQLSSLWGYRSEIQQNVRSVVPLILLGILGGISGALLLVSTPASLFDKVVPFLILTATVLFMAQEPLARWQRARAAKQIQAVTQEPSAAQLPDAPNSDTLQLTIPVAIFLFGIAVYGGYFGAGIGILTLAALGFLGLTNIHQMNGIKNVFTLGINGVAAFLFVLKHLVDWRIVLLMAAGSIFGGYAGAGIARRIGQRNVRRVVICIGLVLTTYYLVKQFVLPH